MNARYKLDMMMAAFGTIGAVTTLTAGFIASTLVGGALSETVIPVLMGLGGLAGAKMGIAISTKENGKFFNISRFIQKVNIDGKTIDAKLIHGKDNIMHIIRERVLNHKEPREIYNESIKEIFEATKAGENYYTESQGLTYRMIRNAERQGLINILDVKNKGEKMLAFEKLTMGNFEGVFKKEKMRGITFERTEKNSIEDVSTSAPVSESEVSKEELLEASSFLGNAMETGYSNNLEYKGTEVEIEEGHDITVDNMNL